MPLPKWTAALAFAALFPAGPAGAGPRYDAPKVSMQLAKAPPALAVFIDTLRATATSNASAAELEALFSDTTEVLAGGVGADGQVLHSFRKFDRNSPKLVQAAEAMEQDERPPGYSMAEHARENVWQFLAGSVDRQLVVGRQPGNAGRLCWGPVVTVNGAALTKAENQAQEANGSFKASIAPVKVYAKDSKASGVIATLPAKSAIRVTKSGNGGMWEVLTPQGKTGFAEASGFVDLYAYGICFARQKAGNWLIDAIMNRTD